MKLKWKIVLPVLALLLISTIVTTLICYSTTKNTVDLMVEDIIDSNLDTLIAQTERTASSDKAVSDELDRKNLALSRAFAEIVRLNAALGPLDLQDAPFFQGIADALGVDEVHIMDADGVLIGGNIEGYYGFDFKTSEQTLPFLRMLDDPTFELAQEPQPNGAEGVLFQYVGVARTDEKGIVQVGIDARVLQEFRKHLDIAQMAATLKVGETGGASIISDGIITYNQNSEKIGQDVSKEDWYKQITSGRGKAWIDMDGESFFSGFANLNGMTLLIMFPKTEYDGYLSSVGTMGTVSAAIAFLVALFVFLLITLILKPIRAITEASKTISGGNFNFTLPKRTGDEIGVLGGNFEKMSDTFKSYVDEINFVLNCLVKGDLQQKIEREYAGQFASIKDSINAIGRMLGGTILEISCASDMVSSGAKQIADGSQTLAQASAEQAASVESLSSSIADIAKKTKANADMADNAAILADTIRSNAEEGSRQMDEMIGAVREINEASQNIGRVIKVIDDIAYQTNILALNAAVEAARAGRHGKGFAVVADEVRNLASKSAEAARNTGEMIQDSMEKAELGARIAGETAVSLAGIVSRINESTLLISEIAKSSEEQTHGIATINSGIDQVVQVVQQNCATAEESAAASEEMSSQSRVLQELISRFRINDGDGKPVLSA